MHKLNNDIYEKTTSVFISLHNEWKTIELNPFQSALLIIHTIGDGNVQHNYDIILICAGTASNKNGNYFRIISNNNLVNLNWNSGTSIGVQCLEDIWIQGSILYL